MKKLFLIFLSIIFSVTGIVTPSDDLAPIPGRQGTPTDENIELFEKIFESETVWLASMQLENGAYPMTYTANGEVRINPYFADFVALALLDRPEKYSDSVKKYTDWHFSHLNTTQTDRNGVDGTIYDYVITLENGKITKECIAFADGKESYDSTDSYAATFLTVLNKYHNKTADSEYIIEHSTEIQRVTNAMLSTFHKGLTTAKPDSNVKYLMDNCEVYEGTLAAAELFKDVLCIADPALTEVQKKCENTAIEIARTIENKLWMPLADHYEAGIRKHISFPSDIFSWNQYYPSATAQLFPIIHGLIAPNTERANKLYDKFCEKYDWENFNYPDAFYWGSNLQAAVAMNDIDSAVVYLKNYEKLIDNHAYPLYNADAAKVCLALNTLLNKYSH